MSSNRNNNSLQSNIGFVAAISFLAVIVVGLFIYTYLPQFAVNRYESNFPTKSKKQCSCNCQMSKNTFVHRDTTKNLFNSNAEIVDEKERNTRNGTIGDTFGGMLGPTVGLFAAFLTFLAFWVQYQANEQQKKHLNQQAFEDTFFRLLDNHQRIVESMDIVKKDDANHVLAKSRDCFKTMYNELENKIGEQTDIVNVNKQYSQVQDSHKSDLHHYFRFLYHILKFIKNSDINESEKFKYASILRATLSAYEIVFIFYNGLHDYGKSHFKPLLEEFSFLKNLDESLLFDESHDKEYAPIARAGSEQRKLLLDKLK